MDAPEDRDVKLQRASPELLADFEASLQRYLWSTRTKTTSPQAKSDLAARRFVSQNQTDRLIKLLEPFQEWPQLLDPHLQDFLQPLVSAFINYLCKSQSQYFSLKRRIHGEVIPLPRGISKILYTFCKIRGDKIISRFLNNEPRYLDLMLDSYQKWSQVLVPIPDTMISTEPVTWEERYIMLLWLSHLLLSPFDLNSISSMTLENISSNIENVSLPRETPAVARQIILISIRNLESAGREREAARALLVRLVLRPDMHKLGLLHFLLEWSLSSLDPSQNGLQKPIYTFVGILSFLNGVITSSSKDIIAPFLNSVFKLAQLMITRKSVAPVNIFSSAMARKLLIKILRSITLKMLQIHDSTSTSDTSSLNDSVLEDTIDQLLAFLADKDTSVRFVASKALSVIAAKLDSSIAIQIVEAIIESFNENMLWETDINHTSENPDPLRRRPSSVKCNLSAIDPLRWHGLVMTLSYLIYHRSATPGQLPNILNTLIIALGFEQRSSVGSSIGTSVRDAACFGIWALARRYSTEELLAADTSAILKVSDGLPSCPILQVLANKTLLAATLDSSGNIRRGASAALQELIGRHPDVILEGIALVQIVDYNAVSLRSKAMLDVAVTASRLETSYRATVLDGLLDWRGVGSPDADSRHWAASAIGMLATSDTQADFDGTMMRVLVSLKTIQTHQIEERHGLLLSLAAMIAKADPGPSNTTVPGRSFKVHLAEVWEVFCFICSLSEREFRNSTLRPELTAEALCTLISALSLTSSSNKSLDVHNNLLASPKYVSLPISILEHSLSRKEVNVIKISSRAAQDLFSILNVNQRYDIMSRWVSLLGDENSRQYRSSGGSLGHIAGLGAVFHYFSKATKLSQPAQTIIDTLLTQIKPQIEVESRVGAIQSLRKGVLSHNIITSPIIEALQTCLDDYTTDQRGDIGSWVRIEAIDAIGEALQHHLLTDEETKRCLLAKVCRLAAEKLDKVRLQAWICIQNNWCAFFDGIVPTNQFRETNSVSTEEYYQQILDMWSVKWLSVSVLKGYISSAGAGSESVIRSSRAALGEYTEKLSTADLDRFCTGIITIVRTHMSEDRIIIPALDVIAFLFDVAILNRLDGETFDWRDVFILVRQSHYKSRKMYKLEVAIHIYTGLAMIHSIKGEVVRQLCSMLLHPYPLVRHSAADSLFQIAPLTDLRRLRLSDPPKDLRTGVQTIRRKLEVDNKSPPFHGVM